MTKRFLLLLCIAMAWSILSQAQWKLTTTSGLSQSVSSKPDSLLFAKKTGFLAQVNVAHYWGRIGLGLKGGTVSSKAIDGFANTKPPAIPDSIVRLGQRGGGVQSTYALIGVELCLCYKQLKIMPNIKVGVVSSKTDSTKIILESQPGIVRRYDIGGSRQSSFGWNVGVNIVYKVTNHFGIALSADYLSYKVQTTLRDFRTPAIIKNIKQPRRLVNLGLGVYYNL
jgi:hypothetical protein